jgi:hypothetical protein
MAPRESPTAVIMKKTIFTQSLIRENCLDEGGFERWAFSSGMLFNSTERWWGDRGERNSPHEGLDFLLYKDRQGGIVRLAQETRIPILYAGVVTGIINDFLGKSVIVAHGLSDCHRPLVSVYGHILPDEGIQTGRSLSEGETIGTLAPCGKSKSNVLPHLHVSLGWLKAIDLCHALDWRKMSDQAVITMIDPLGVIDGDYCLLSAVDEELPIAGG